MSIFGRGKKKADKGKNVDRTPAVQRERQPREVRRKWWANWLGAYDLRTPMMPSTTKQTAALHLAVASAPTSSRGLYAGEDLMTGWPVFSDPIQGYKDRELTSPNVVIIGDVGGGKSSMAKTWVVMRNLMLGRRVVVVDKKMQAAGDESGEHEGEYALLARALGVEPIRFTGKPGGVRINPLDPVITGSNGMTAGQTELLRAILAEVMDRPLTQEESKALRVARDGAVRVAQRQGRIATIQDVTRFLLEPDEETVQAQRGLYSVQDYAQWGRLIGFALEECIEGDLAGLIDGATSEQIQLRAGLTVFDISALPDSGPAVPVVMAIINTWLRSTLIAQTEVVPTFLLVEEGWHLVTGSFAKVSQQNTKKSRGLALSTVTCYQHLSDVPADSPAIATIKEAGTVILFKQERDDDATHCQRLFGLPPAASDLMKNLEQGCCLFKVGTQPAILMRAARSPIEAELANTDGALLSKGRISVTEVDAVVEASDLDAPVEPVPAGGPVS